MGDEEEALLCEAHSQNLETLTRILDCWEKCSSDHPRRLLKPGIRASLESVRLEATQPGW